MDALLAWIYPNRVLIAVVSAVVVAAVAVIGWRLGWQRVAQRHPRMAAGALVAILLVSLPLAWYLGSPLIIRTELVEAAPTVVALASSPPPPSRTPQPSASATPIPTPSPTPRVLRGEFKGADGFHFTHGTATLVETAPGRFTLRLERFSVRNGPDLYVYLSTDAKGYAPGAIELGRLKATDGSFNYALPAGARVSTLHSVVIWCKAFSVQFGVAPLSG